MSLVKYSLRSSAAKPWMMLKQPPTIRRMPANHTQPVMRTAPGRPVDCG